MLLKPLISFRQFVFIKSLALFTFACTDLPATNPFDPSAPPAIQAEGTIEGRIFMSVAGDLGDEVYTLTLLDQSYRPVTNERGESLQVPTRVQEDLDALELSEDDPLNVIGSFTLKIKPGVYVLFFDPSLNQKERRLSEKESFPIQVSPGMTNTLDLLIPVNPNFRDAELCFNNKDCPLGTRCDDEGQCVVDITADRDLDGVPDGVDDQMSEGRRDNCPLVANTDQDDLDGDRIGDACDEDMDGDGVLNRSDNCPRHVNPLQGNADGESESADQATGNACDDDTPGITLRGRLDYTAISGADPSEAVILMNSERVDATIEASGDFTLPHVLPEPGSIVLQVRWPGFVDFIAIYSVPDEVETFDVSTLELEQDNAANARRWMKV